MQRAVNLSRLFSSVTFVQNKICFQSLSRTFLKVFKVFLLTQYNMASYSLFLTL